MLSLIPLTFLLSTHILPITASPLATRTFELTPADPAPGAVAVPEPQTQPKPQPIPGTDLSITIRTGRAPFPAPRKILRLLDFVIDYLKTKPLTEKLNEQDEIHVDIPWLATFEIDSATPATQPPSKGRALLLSTEVVAIVGTIRESVEKMGPQARILDFIVSGPQGVGQGVGDLAFGYLAPPKPDGKMNLGVVGGEGREITAEEVRVAIEKRGKGEQRIDVL